MNKVTELENALTELFRKGTEVGYSETEIDEFLEDIDYDTLLQAVWNNAETVYSYRADGEHEFSMDYRGTELFKQRATLLYEDMGEGFAGAVVAARSMELWLLEDMGFAKWFRNAVLPADCELYAEVMRNRPEKSCLVCGKPIFSTSNRAKYCPFCAKRERRKQDAKRKREHYWNLRK